MASIPFGPIVQAGAIPYRLVGGRLQIALVTNRAGLRWLVPKGRVSKAEVAWQSAAREAFEEAGLVGTVHPQPLGAFEYVKRGSTFTVDVFAMQVVRELASWPEQGSRRRCWVDVEQAATIVCYPDLGRCIETLPSMHLHARIDLDATG